jgi:hypothetical protein
MTLATYDDRTEPEVDYDKTTPELTPDQLLIRIEAWWNIGYPPAKK